MVAFGHGLAMVERIVQPEEAELLVSDLDGMDDVLVLAVLRDREHISFQRLGSFRLAAGDAIVYIEDETTAAPLARRN